MADESTTAPRPPVVEARGALDRMLRLTAQASARLDGGFVAPQVEAAWRSQQEGLMQLAAAAALVSIAESLAAIAERVVGDG